jgi:hypothetical protein
MLRIPHCLDNRLTDGGKVISPTHRPRSTPQKHYFSTSSIHFCYRLSEPPCLERPQGLGKLKKFIRLIGLEPATFRLVAEWLNHCATEYCVRGWIQFKLSLTSSCKQLFLSSYVTAQSLRPTVNAIQHELTERSHSEGNIPRVRGGFTLYISAWSELPFKREQVFRPAECALFQLMRHLAQYLACWYPKLRIFFCNSVPTKQEHSGSPVFVQLRQNFESGSYHVRKTNEGLKARGIKLHAPALLTAVPTFLVTARREHPWSC